LQKEVTKHSKEGGSSFSNATTIAKGSSKTDTLGLELEANSSQYYKIKITGTSLTKVTVKKYGSSSKTDTLAIAVYDSNKKLVEQAEGYIFEGQGSAYVYVRDPKNKGYSKAGTYYVKISKYFKDSSFRYDVSW